jgi:hypothetical protein
MKSISAISVVCLSIVLGHAQTVVPPNIRATNTIDAFLDHDRMGMNEVLYGIPIPPGKVIGDTYLDTNWKMGTILLYDKDKMIERILVRYDIHANEIDVKAANGIKAIPGAKVKSFVWIDSIGRTPDYYVNAKDFKVDGTPFMGFFQVLCEGALPLMMKTSLVVKKSDYNVSLDIGSKDDKILKKEDFYCLKDGNAIEVPSSKKKLLPLFQDKAYQVEDFIKDNGLSVSKKSDLVQIFNYYNSLYRNN